MSARVLEKLFTAMQGARGIPAMENIVTSVLGTLNDINGSTRQLAQHICEDFALTQKVLKLANSAMYAPFAKEAASVTAAVNILGTDALTHVVLSTSVATAAEIDDDKNLSRTLMASELARSMCPDRAETVSIAGLMYDLGHLLAARFLPQEVKLIEAKVAAGGEADKAARDVLGMTFQQLGAEVARRWRLPASIVSVIEGTGDPELVKVAQFSNSASSLIQEGRTEEVSRLVAALDLPNVDKSKLAGLIQRKLEESRPEAPPVRTPAAQALEHLFEELAAVPWKTAEDLAGAMFAGISRTLKTTHCLLFMRSRSGDFVVRYGQGKGIDELRARFRIAGEYKPTAFHAVVQNNVDVSIADVSKLKPSSLPDGYAALFPKVGRFVILPIAHGSVSGLIYCDWDCDAAGSETELVALKKLRNLFLPFFPA